MSYTIQTRMAAKSGWHTPAEARSFYGRYTRDEICVHWWNSPSAVKDSDHDTIVNYILNKASRGIGSVHYVLSNSKITRLVNDDDVAWHAQSGNPVSIGIELSPHLNDEGYKKAGWLIAQIEQKYKKTMTLRAHKHWFNTQCPGHLDTSRMRKEANKWKSGVYAPAGDEMITSKDAATKLYKMLRPNAAPSQAEIDSTVNKRSFVQFLNDAQNEVNRRDEMYRQKDTQIRELVNELQAAKTQAAELMQRPTIQAYEDLQNKLGSCQTKVVEASRPVEQVVIEQPKPEPPKLSLFAQILLWFANRKKKA